MTVQTVNINSFPKQSSNEHKGPWAILGILSLVRDTLTKGQQKIAGSVEKLIEIGNKVQDKRSKELKQLTKLGLEALKEETKSKLFRDIGLGLTIAAIVGGPIVASIAAGNASIFMSASQFIAPLLSLAGGGLQISAESMTLKTASKQLEIAEIDKHNNIDKGHTNSNVEMVSFAGNTLTDATKAKVSLQKVITEVINSTGSALQVSVR